MGSTPLDFEVYLKGLDQIPIVNIREKSPHASARVGGKNQHSVLNKACLQGNLVTQNLTYWGIISPTDLGKGKYSIPGHRRQHVPPKEKRKTLRAICGINSLRD